MVTRAGKQKNYPDLLDTLLTMEQNTLAAYDEAVERIDNDIYREKLEQFRTDHARAIIQLSKIAEDIHLAVPGRGPKNVITSGKVVLADMIGDGMILRAMESTEKDAYTAYENATGNMVVGDSLYEACSDNLLAINEHIEWIQDITP